MIKLIRRFCGVLDAILLFRSSCLGDQNQTLGRTPDGLIVSGGKHLTQALILLLINCMT